MGLRALVGVQDADGTFEARHVHYDGCPTVVVPALTALVYNVHRDQDAAVHRLLSRDWGRIYLLPDIEGGRTVVCAPADRRHEAETGRILAEDAGDREWAYLFGGDRLHVYLGVFPETGVKRWQPWADWPVSELPGVGMDELLDVQRRGYREQWRASDFRTYMAAVRERFGEAM